MHGVALFLASNVWIFESSLLIVAIAAGVLGAILGLGGGVIIVPALTLLYGINIRYAVGASIVSVIATSSAAAAAYVRDHVTNIRVAMLLEVATTTGALGGAALSTRVPTDAIFLIFALVLLYSAAMMFRRRHSLAHTGLGDRWAQRLRLNASYPDPVLNQEVDYEVTHVPLGFTLMIAAGILSGLLGIGSGALKVPAMDSAMRLPIKVSTATSSFMIGVTGAASAGAYYSKGDILPALAGPVALGVLAGSWLGTLIMMKLHSHRIRKLFIIVLLVIAAQMALRAFGIQVR